MTRVRRAVLLAALLLLSTALSRATELEPASEAEPTSEPDLPEPDGGEPWSEGEPNGEPEGEDEPVGATATHSYAEPEPAWEEAKVLWGSAWQVHIYFFGVMFGVVALYSLFSVLRLWKRKHLLSQKYFISLNLLIFLMGAVRSVYLLVDAYNSNATFPPIVAYILYTIFLPCVTSTFSLLFLSLLAATRMKFISPSIQKTKVILFVILVHFVLAITTDILTVCHLDARIILFVCQVFYIVWGLFLFVGFMYIFGRLYKAAKDRQIQMNKYAVRKLGTSASGKQSYKPEQHKLTLSLGTIVTLVSSILGLLTVVLLIYGMVDVYGVFVEGKVPESWRWWGYHTAFRTLELAICITVSYVATQPFRYSTPSKYSSLSTASDSETSSRCSNCFFFFAPCWSWCYREHSYMLPDVEWSQLQSEGDSGSTLKRHNSEKSDFPLEQVVVGSAGNDDTTKVAPVSDELSLGKTSPATLKSEHGTLLFSSNDRIKMVCDMEYVTPM